MRLNDTSNTGNVCLEFSVFKLITGNIQRLRKIISFSINSQLRIFSYLNVKYRTKKFFSLPNERKIESLCHGAIFNGRILILLFWRLIDGNFLVIRPGNRKPRKPGTEKTADKGTWVSLQDVKKFPLIDIALIILGFMVSGNLLFFLKTLSHFYLVMLLKDCMSLSWNWFLIS